MNRVLRIISLVYIAFLVMIGIGCTNKQAIANEVIADVQKDVPFTIIVPSYFPSGIKIVPSGISGPSTSEITNSEGVGITYYGNSSDKEIIIDEENIVIDVVPNGPSETFNVNGVEVLSQSVEMGSATKITRGIEYSWNRNGVNFQVRIFGYNQTEGKKVVESMIK